MVSAAYLVIEYRTTVDMPDGQCLPPFIDANGAVWRVVRRLPGARTRWRRIRLSSGKTEPAIAACGPAQLHLMAGNTHQQS